MTGFLCFIPFICCSCKQSDGLFVAHAFYPSLQPAAYTRKSVIAMASDPPAKGVWRQLRESPYIFGLAMV